MARTKKSVAEKKLNGTYKPSRHSKQEQTENIITELITQDKKTFELPAEITNKEIVSFCNWHLDFLNQLNLITPADSLIFFQMYRTAQQIQDIDEQLHNTDITEDFEKYTALSKLRIKLCKLYNEVAVQFYVTPTARAKLTLDHLEIEKKQNQNQTVIGKLIQSKRNPD